MTTLSDDGSVTATLLFCVSAAGEKMPPFYLFQGKYVVDGLLQGAPPDSLIGVSENGWMDSDHFFAWLTRFVAHIDKTRKDARALLVVDGHRSRIQLVAAEYAKQHNVDLLIFPSHTTHLLQPLDVACFKPFVVCVFRCPRALTCSLVFCVLEIHSSLPFSPDNTFQGPLPTGNQVALFHRERISQQVRVFLSGLPFS